MTTIRQIDRLFAQKNGQWRYFASELLKVAVVSLLFIALARWYPSGILPCLLGLSTVILAVMLEALRLLIRSLRHGT